MDLDNELLTSQLSGVQKIQFDQSRRELFEEKSNALLQRTLDQRDAFHRKQKASNWKLFKQNKVMAVYTDRNAAQNSRAADSGVDSNNRTHRTLMISGIVPGTTEQVVRGVYADTTEAMRTVKAIQDSLFLDGMVLQVFETGGIREPVIFSGIKWMVWKGMAMNLMADRDAPMYEKLGNVETDEDAFVYNTYQSVDLPELPANTTPSMKRVTLSVCYLYHQINPGHVAFFCIADADVLGLVPPQFVDQFMIDRVSGSWLNSFTVASAKAFTALMISRADYALSLSTKCDICQSSGSIFNKLKYCRACKCRLCRSCAKTRVVFRLRLRTRKPSTEKFCRDCVYAVESNGGYIHPLPSHIETMQTSESSDSSSPTKQMQCPMMETFDAFPNVPSPTSSISIQDSTQKDDLQSHADSHALPESHVSEDPEEVLAKMWRRKDSEVSWNQDERHRFSLTWSKDSPDELGEAMGKGIDLELLD